MTRFSSIFLCALFLGATCLTASAGPSLELGKASGKMVYDLKDAVMDLRNHTLTFTNSGTIIWNGAVLSADRGVFDQNSGETLVSGHVVIQHDDQRWTGESVHYNFITHQMSTAEFRTGKPPVFAAGLGLHGNPTNNLYYSTNAFVTTDDVSEPAYKIKASRIRVIPGQRIIAHNATLWLGDLPVFYFPYYSRNLGDRANNFNFTPGFGSLYGAFLLSDYTWFLNEPVDGRLHLDYRAKRGVGLGPDLNLHLGRWGELALGYYYLHDEDRGTNFFSHIVAPENRQRFHLSYDATPWTNLTVKALVRYQSDSELNRTFYQGEYRDNPQPDTFIEVNKSLPNFSLDLLTQPRVNRFFETVERLPEVRLTGYRQQVGTTPIFYESESSLGYYRRDFAETNTFPLGLNYEAARADTYHQLTLPKTFFGWLNFTPRVGGRFTYYTQATGPGATTGQTSRGVFNTGAELSYKASRTWPQVASKTLDLDGVRHIVQPSANYVYVPKPNHAPAQSPMFDYELPSLRQLSLDYPAYHAIDSVDRQNVVRLGLENKLQTKRDGQIEDFLRWEMSVDTRLDPGTNQGTFSDLYSDLTFKPRSWLRLESQTRYDLDRGGFRMLLHTVTFEPNNVWSWTVGHFYLHDDLSGLPTALGLGNNIITSSLFYRVNENWGFRANHHFDALNGRMQEQYYTLYRDLRCWTVAVTGGVRDNGSGPKDFNVAFSFSLKALPHGKLGSDTVRPYSLLGQ